MMNNLKYLPTEIKYNIILYASPLHKLCKYNWSSELIKQNIHLLDFRCWNILYIYNFPLVKNIILNYNDVLDVDIIEIKYWYDFCNYQWCLPFLIKHTNELDFLCWRILSKNNWSLSILRNNIDKLDLYCWNELCANGWALNLIKNNTNYLDNKCWQTLCKRMCNSNLIKNNIDKLDNKCLHELCKSKWGLELIMSTNYQYLNQECLYELCKYKWSIGFLKKNKHLLNNDCKLLILANMGIESYIKFNSKN